MFRDLDNFDLRQLLRSIRDKRLDMKKHTGVMGNYLQLEVYAHEKRMSATSHLKQLNRLDLVSILYAMLYTEIMEIDTCPEDNLPTLMNKEWSCPQLRDRLLKRMRGESMNK